MTLIPEDLVYSRDHIWIKKKDEFTGICGITDYIQEKLNTIVFIETIEEGFGIGEEGYDINLYERIMRIESINDYFHIISPLTGKIMKINEQLLDTPDLINSDPYGEGWIFEIDIWSRFEYEELLDPVSYKDYIDSL